MDWFSLLFWRNWLSSFTIEFAVMFSKMSHGVVGVLTTELALAKVCQVELGYPQTLCSNLTNHTDIEILVQKEVNMFEMKGRMMTQVPTILYAIMAGSLSDRFGRKPLMISVMVGQILEGLALRAQAHAEIAERVTIRVAVGMREQAQIFDVRRSDTEV